MSTSGKIRVKKSGVTNDKLVNNRGLTVPSVNFADSFMFSEFGNEDLLEYNQEEQTWYLDMKKMFPGIDRFKITDPVEGELLIYDSESDKFINDSTFLNQLNGIKNDIEEFKKNIEDLKLDDESVSDKINSINNNIQELSTRFSSIESELNTNKEDISNLKSQYIDTNNQLISINNDIGEINGTVINISTEITNIKDSVVDLTDAKDDITEINQKIQTDIEPHLDRIDVEIDDLQRRINIPGYDLTTQIKNFTDQINQLYYIIQQQQQVIDGLNSNPGLPNFRYDMVDKEVPIGLVNGINQVFILEKTPVIGSESVFLNGVLQDSVRDYSLSGNQITFVEPPLEHMVIRCNYRVSINTPTEIQNPIIYNIEYGETPAYFYSLIEKEIPLLLPDGINNTFELLNEPIPGSESVFLNGVLQEPGPGELANYVLENKSIVFVEPPIEGMVIRCTYRKFIENL